MKPGCHLTASDGALRSPCQGINAVARQSDRQPRAATEFGLGFFLVVVGNLNGALKGALQVLCSRETRYASLCHGLAAALALGKKTGSPLIWYSAIAF